MPWLIPLVLLILFEALADVLAKEWSLGRSWFWVLSIGAYIIANSFWLFALKDGSGLTRGAMIFSVASAILAIIIGIVLYHESISQTELIGVGIGVISLIFMLW